MGKGRCKISRVLMSLPVGWYTADTLFKRQFDVEREHDANPFPMLTNSRPFTPYYQRNMFWAAIQNSWERGNVERRKNPQGLWEYKIR